MGTITFSVQTATTQGGVPPQNLSKTYTDTDANIALILQAMQWRYSVPTIPAAGLQWTGDAIHQLIEMTRSFQQLTAPITPVNPT